MEPRIATLLGSESFLDRTAIDQISILPPPSVAPPRPLPVEPTHIEDNAHSNKTTSRVHDVVAAESYLAVSRPQQKPSSRSRTQKSAVPLAEVLNNEEYGHGFSAASNTSIAFGVGFNDILKDFEPRKRRKIDEPIPNAILNANVGSDAEHLAVTFTLPKPTPLQSKKGNRRPRIPPLLQGLHQPPPDAGLFPPITGEKGGFREVLGDISSQDAPQSFAAAVTEKSDKNPERDVQPKDQGNVASLSESPVQTKKERSKGQKRNKWTTQETKDLLTGVSKHGIGNWKKILQDKEFHFNNRTSVDLKDRFRTCCPRDYRHPGTSKETSEASTAVENQPSLEIASSVTSSDALRERHPGKASLRKPRSGTDRKGPAELAEMGIDKPFIKSDRRERRGFTDRDDEALLRGFEIHGTKWRLIRSDPDLGFQTRHPTDLRDRFRIRYPEKFAEAGYKLRPKEEAERRKEMVVDAPRDGISSAQSTKEVKVLKDRANTGKQMNASLSATTAPKLPELSQKTRQLPKPPIPSLPTAFDDFADLVSEDETAYSPITLSRNIFQWADANPSHTSTAPPTATSAGADITSHLNLSILAGMDQFHINPLATLKLPTTTGVTVPSMPTYQSANGAMGHASAATWVPSSAPTYNYTSSSKHSQDILQLTPNLPTIIVPNVPASSARRGVLNLPRPAELLSSGEGESRADNQNASLLWEDHMNMNLIAPLSSGDGNVSGGGNNGHSRLWGFGESDLLGPRSLLNSSI